MKTNPKSSSFASCRLAILALLPAVLLAGCQDVTMDDTYYPSYQERFPIRVSSAPVKMNLSASSGSLRPDQINSLIGFAQDARNNATSHVAVRWASGSAKSRQVAHEAVGVLIDQGVPQSMIGTGSYHGSSAVVSLSFQRKVAVTTECGDWSENLAADYRNLDYPNFGCTAQNNLAAMVANPEDFEQPRAMSPAPAAAQSHVIQKYYKGEVAP